ncbi:MAG TPA: DEAD/DEAH box helicase [Prolixibacteraceae bacterium]|nr:DEAD/DEAH box helicase [Prolixibacteraceae bacterium]
MINEKLDTQLIEVLKENGFTESTELEQVCIPKIKSGRDLLCIAADGSGKTSTIIVSVLQRLKSSLDDNPRAIIVVQNKERAQEMKAEFDRLGEYTDLRVYTACEDEKIADQKDKIYMGSDVVIGTARRLNQIYTLYALNLGVVKIFAIDNAELVIKSLNYTQIDRLSESMPKAQRVIFTTQMNEWIERFADAFMNVQEIIEIEEKEEEPESESGE